MNDMSEKVMDILLVEDNPGDVRLTREALMEAGIDGNLHAVADGVEGLAFLRREGAYAEAPRPDMLLLDLNLPKKSGLELLSEMREDEGLKDIPVVILTTSGAKEDVMGAYALHANFYVIKTLDVEEFINVIKFIKDFMRGKGS